MSRTALSRAPILLLLRRPAAIPICRCWIPPATAAALSAPHRPAFSTSRLQQKSPQFPPRPKPPPETEMWEEFLKGSGPGGQKINKTNSAVQITHMPTGLVIKCQETRSREQNRKIARQRLADKLDDMTRGSESRAATVGAFKAKKRASSAKKSRRKHRRHDEEKKAAAEAGNAADQDEDFEGEQADLEAGEPDGASPGGKGHESR